ncbi:MAG: GSDH domain-containing protein, partial [Bacteroidetes bacterium]|nr:GSDH domain-containing protein [Bacteroidota bacterium]
MTLRTIQSTLAAMMFLLGNVTARQQTFSTSDGVKFRIEIVLEHLEIPWSIVFDQDGNMYFTERPGRLQILRKGQSKPILIAELKEVAHRGEGGLMGLALHPKFASNNFVYLSYTTPFKGDLVNKVVRFKLENNKLMGEVDIIPRLPGSSVHNGCRLRFGPDGKLYVTAGDAADREIAQDKSSLGGKILRLNDDGSIPSDNPDPRSAIYAVGVRNPQGIDFHPLTGLLFETEHGPSGFDGPGGGDEVNIIESGKNYGWPEIHHKVKRDGMESPLLEYTPAVAPASGM